MSFLADVLAWFTTASHWQGEAGVPHRLFEHVAMSAAAVLAAAAVALPAGTWLGHRGRGGWLVLNLANVGRAVPSLAILALAQQAIGLSGWPGFGARPALIALVALAVPPLVSSAYVGMREVDVDVREAARGMGMTGGQLLRRVELPLALPLVMAGVRTAAVQVVATATLAALVGYGGLGALILLGLRTGDNVDVFASAVAVAVLALATELGLALVQRALTPQALRRRLTSDQRAEAAVPRPI